MNWGTLNLIDFVLVVIVLLSAYNGWRRGFILGVLGSAGLGFGSVCGPAFLSTAGQVARSHVHLWSEVWDRPLAFILIAILVIVAVQFLGKALLGRVSKDTHERVIQSRARCSARHSPTA